MTDHEIPGEVVLIRTSAGQDAVFDDQELDAKERRLLRMLNGYTSLSDLMSRLGQHDDWKAAAASLLARRLVVARPSTDAVLSPVAGEKPVDQFV